ncbi:hypothetical protein AB205_0018570 [Aquarana catesbeiana]|uniref:Uncharacterized protein n=1 Tax=Aquarana catesbeiana TaxID=8400 RepID=A0A2G9SLQ4_AQUCT|nr:hypothetical protein AB205_0018570 [Aquarana catesbeiana]
MCDALPKKVSISALRKGKNHVFSLELCQNRQLDDTSKQCFILLFLSSNICVLSILCVLRDPQPPKEGEIPTPQPEDVEKGEVHELGEIVTTTGDVDVVKEETHFTSASAQILIGEIMVCNRDLQKKGINDVEKDSKTSLKF